MTIQQASLAASRQLRGVSDAPYLDAERLLLHVLGRRESSWLLAHSDERIRAATAAQFTVLVRRRRTGEPLAYILGEWEFYGRPFYVTADVLIPRPSTEALVEAVLSYVQLPSIARTVEENTGPFIVADVGTGSGCVAVTLALEARIKNLELRVMATDISAAALAVARRNVERHGVPDAVSLMRGDLLEPLREQRVDLIVSNPPYVPTAALARAGQQCATIGLTFEPRAALDGGSDGKQYTQQLKKAGWPAFIEEQEGCIRSYWLSAKASSSAKIRSSKAARVGMPRCDC